MIRGLAATVVLAAAFVPASASAQDAPPACAPDGDPVVVERHFDQNAAESYDLVPFAVDPATSRVEVTYEWGDEGELPGTPLTETTVDLGLWDEDGPTAWEGFRGWSGSRHTEVHVQADSATRGYLAAPVEAGEWNAELGIAAVSPQGGWYRVEITCLDPEVGAPPSGTPADPDPVDPNHVARDEPGWYHGDFHLHGYHSNPEAPAWDDFVAAARDAGLEFTPITEYVTSAHWYELGAVQRANPDLLLWPSREIITYDGHGISLGETWGLIEYRHGFRDITMADIHAAVVARGNLFQVAHPTTFAGPLFSNFCRGCAWEFEDTDWSLVDTIEVQSGPAVVRPNSDESAPGIQNPFMVEAIDLWEELLLEGHRITAVGGSDDKHAGEGSSPYGAYAPIGVPAVAVYADELSRDGLEAAIRAGRVYLRSRGVADSPSLELEATTDTGQRGTFGASLPADDADVTVTVAGAQGQLLIVSRNGEELDAVPITADPWEHTFTAERDPDGEGPLGTFWRVDTRDHEALTTVANPIFLAGADGSGGGEGGSPDGGAEAGPSGDQDTSLPATGGGAAPLGIALLLVVGARLVAWRPQQRPQR